MTEETRVNKNAELVELETYTPARIFSDEGVAEIFKIIEDKVKDAPQDISTEAGRKEIASLAYKVARSKTTVDNIGKEYVAERKEALKLIDNQRKKLREGLDIIKNRVRKPLDDFEAKEAERINVRHNRIGEIFNSSQSISEFDNSEKIKNYISGIEKLVEFDWQEFEFKAKETYGKAYDKLTTDLQKALDREKEAEQKRLQEIADAEERGRLKAIEDARIEAERVAAVQKAKQEKAEADAEIARKEAEERISNPVTQVEAPIEAVSTDVDEKDFVNINDNIIQPMAMAELHPSTLEGEFLPQINNAKFFVFLDRLDSITDLSPEQWTQIAEICADLEIPFKDYK